MDWCWTLRVGQLPEEDDNGGGSQETHHLEADENLADVPGDPIQLTGDANDATQMDASADKEGDTYVTAPEPSATVEIPAEEAADDEALSPLATLIARGMRASVFPMMMDIVAVTVNHRATDVSAKSIRPGSGKVKKQLSEFSPEEIQAAIGKEKAALARRSGRLQAGRVHLRRRDPRGEDHPRGETGKYPQSSPGRTGLPPAPLPRLLPSLQSSCVDPEHPADRPTGCYLPGYLCGLQILSPHTSRLTWRT